jgi:hypothetical protein
VVMPPLPRGAVAPALCDSWDGLFRSRGMRNPEPRMRMRDGFNERWIDFQDDRRVAIKGQTDAIAVIMALVARCLGPLPRYRRNAKPNP